MTQSQSNFIDILLDQIGFRGSPLKESYWAKFFMYPDPKVDYVSTVIERLIEERRLRRTVRKRLGHPKHVAVSDLAAFGFCPASFAIKETFDVMQVAGVEEGLEEHRKSDTIEKLINRVRSTDRSVEPRNLTATERAFYADVLNSEAIIRGWVEGQKPFFSAGDEIAGLPDYVFKRKDGTQFHVDERHTWREEVSEPWFSHKVQVYGYLYALKVLDLTGSYIVYFRWDQENHTQAFGRPMIFSVERSNEARRDLARVYKAVRHLRGGGSLQFHSDRVNVNKCFACSVRYYCHHKGGLNNVLRLPYPKYWSPPIWPA